MLLRGMHDGGCDDIYIIVTDLKRQEMDDVTAYFELATKYAISQRRRNSIEQQIQTERTFNFFHVSPRESTKRTPDMRLKYLLANQHRLPCFPQIDLTLRAILYEKRPRFIALFSHQTTSYSQIFFTHRDHVPDPDIFYDYPTGCPNPCCTEECEMIRFPRRGASGAAILPLVNSKGRRRRFKRKEMCNWIECDASFGELVTEEDHDGTESVSAEGSEGGSSSGASDEHDYHDETEGEGAKVSYGHVCGKCKLVRYCSQKHQFADWPEHKRVCVKAIP